MLQEVKALHRVDRFEKLLLTKINSIEHSSEEVDCIEKERPVATAMGMCNGGGGGGTDNNTTAIAASSSISEDSLTYIGYINSRSSGSISPQLPQQYNNNIDDDEGRNDNNNGTSPRTHLVSTSITTQHKNDSNTNTNKKKNNRFQRFVAARQHQRAKTLKNLDDDRRALDTLNSAVVVDESLRQPNHNNLLPKQRHNIYTTSNDEEESTQDHKEQEDVDVVTSSPTREYMISSHTTPHTTPEGSPTQIISHTPEGSPTQIITPSSSSSMKDCNSQDSPTSVRAVSSFTTEENQQQLSTVKKQLFVRVESKSVKGIIQQKDKKKQQDDDNDLLEKKKLSWYDDIEHKDKPFTLKTDESFDNDDELLENDNSSWSDIDNNVFSNCQSPEKIQDYIAKKVVQYSKRVKWIDEDDNTPYEVPELPRNDTVMEDDGDDSYCDQDEVSMCTSILDKRRREIFTNMLQYYKARVEESLSQAVDEIFTNEMTIEERSLSLDASINEAIDPLIDKLDAIIMSDDDHNISSLFKLDLFATPSNLEDDEEMSNCSDATPQVCNTACFGA